MIITIEICDVCRTIHRGGEPVTTCQTGEIQWDVGSCCSKKPFTVVKNANVIKNHLLARIEALIVTELKLMKEPQ